MIPRDVKAPTVAIPFEKLLKIVAIVDAGNVQTRELLDHITGLGYSVEVAEGCARDIAEDASVGACRRTWRRWARSRFCPGW